MPLTAPTNVMKMVVDYQTHACGSGINQFVQLWTELNQRPLCCTEGMKDGSALNSIRAEWFAYNPQHANIVIHHFKTIISLW